MASAADQGDGIHPAGLMLALSLGSLLFAVMLRLIAADLRVGEALAQHWREQAGSGAALS